MGIDHPRVITKPTVLDIAPTGESFARADKEFALGYWIWSFLAAPAPIPEQLVAAAPDLLVNHMLDSWSDDPAAVSPELRQAYIASLRDPATVAAICEEYRAAGLRTLPARGSTRRHDPAPHGVPPPAWRTTVIAMTLYGFQVDIVKYTAGRPVGGARV
jgi:hypothetical protein